VSSQRYVSDELTHFVGKDLMDESGSDPAERDKRLYDRLLAILRQRELTTGGTRTGVNADPSIEKEGLTITAILESTGSEDVRDMFKAYVVCFCDIPVGDVAIHTAKYSPFGIAFSREYLLNHGASPVFYVAEDAVVEGEQTYRELFSTEMHFASQYISEQAFGKEEPDAQRVHNFLTLHVFPFVKSFKARSTDDDPENFYMEREWRRYGDLKFALDDVCRVYLPRSFARRLRGDLPDYYGQVTFTDS
jgi:hypothetical protein